MQELATVNEIVHTTDMGDGHTQQVTAVDDHAKTTVRISYASSIGFCSPTKNSRYIGFGLLGK